MTIERSSTTTGAAPKSRQIAVQANRLPDGDSADPRQHDSDAGQRDENASVCRHAGHHQLSERISCCLHAFVAGAVHVQRLEPGLLDCCHMNPVFISFALSLRAM